LTPRLLLLEGRELNGIVPTCGGASAKVAAAAVRSPRVNRSDSSRATFDAQQALAFNVEGLVPRIHVPYHAVDAVVAKRRFYIRH
jgi:hypothetical protein